MAMVVILRLSMFRREKELVSCLVMVVFDFPAVVVVVVLSECLNVLIALNCKIHWWY